MKTTITYIIKGVKVTHTTTTYCGKEYHEKEVKKDVKRLEGNGACIVSMVTE